MKTALILSLLLSLAALADQVQEERFDKLAIGARSYTNAVLRIIDASTAVIHHEGSPEKIKLQDLPEPLRSKYYDPQKIQADAQARAKLRAEKEGAQAAARRQAIEDYKKLNFRVVAGKAEDIKDWTSLDGKIRAVQPDGLILQLYTERQVYHSGPPAGGLASIGAYSPDLSYYTKERE